MQKLKEWLAVSSREEKEQLAEMATNGSVPQLYHLSGEQRNASAGKAGAIAKASELLHEANPKLPVLTRMDLCPACAECEYAQRCGDDLV